MISDVGHIYFIDFETSIISLERQPWFDEFHLFMRYPFHHYKYTRTDSKLLQDCTDPSIYSDYIDKLEGILGEILTKKR